MTVATHTSEQGGKMVADDVVLRLGVGEIDEVDAGKRVGDAEGFVSLLEGGGKLAETDDREFTFGVEINSG